MISSCELTTARLRLVPCNDEHLEGLNALNSDPAVMRYLTGRAETLAETRAMIERVQARWAKWGYSWWTFIERQSGEIGWRVRRDRWRRGLAGEAGVAMAEFAFVRLGAETLYAVSHPDNSASMAVMVKLGMRYRGLEDWYARQVATYELTAQAWRTARRTGI